MSKAAAPTGSSAARRAASRSAKSAANGESSDKRKVPRVKILARVAHDGAKKPLEVENASATGMLLKGAAKDHPTLIAGAEIELSVDSSDHAAGAAGAVKIKARLVRVTYGEHTHFGLEITKITDEARRHYYELLALAHLRAGK
jgi:hypothetical protein